MWDTNMMHTAGKSRIGGDGWLMVYMQIYLPNLCLTILTIKKWAVLKMQVKSAGMIFLEF